MKISNTAVNLAERVWVRKYNERWKPKTEAAINKEASPKITKLAPQRIEANHFVS